MRQGIRRRITFFLAVVDSEMLSRKFIGQLDLLLSQVLGIHESAEIVVVGKDKNLKFAALQVVMPSFKSLKYGQELFVVNFLPSLRRDHLSKKKEYRVLLPRIRS